MPRILLAFALLAGTACGVIDGLTGASGRSDAGGTGTTGGTTGTTDDGGGKGGGGGSHSGGGGGSTSDGGAGGETGGTTGGSTAGNWTWHGPVKLDGGLSAQSGAPRAAVRPDGRVFAAWEEVKPQGNRTTIWLATRAPKAAGWDAPRAVPAIAGFPGASHPQVAVGASGKAVVVFDADDGTSSPVRSVRAARFGDDLAVASEDIVRLDNPGSRSPSLSQARSLAVDETGQAFAAWGEAGGLWATTSAGTAWGFPVQLDSNPVSTDLVDVAASRGKALVNWTRGDTALAEPVGLSGDQVQASEPLTLSQSFGGATVWGHAALREGFGVTVYQNSGHLSSALYRGEWYGVAGAQVGASVGLQALVATNAAGHAVALWQQRPDGSTNYLETNLWAATFDGTRWSTPQLVSAPGLHRKAWSLALDMNDKGDAVAAWADFDAGGTYTRIWANLLKGGAGGGTWSGPNAIDQDSPDAALAGQPENVRSVGVALTPDGSGATVVWMEHESNGTPRTWAKWLE